MMLRKILVYTLFFYLLALLQTTILAGFEMLGVINLIFVSVVLINLFDQAKDYSGIYAGLSAGFFLDIFSAAFIGQNILILLALALFIKIVLKKYVWPPAL